MIISFFPRLASRFFRQKHGTTSLMHKLTTDSRWRKEPIVRRDHGLEVQIANFFHRRPDSESTDRSSKIIPGGLPTIEVTAAGWPAAGNTDRPPSQPPPEADRPSSAWAQRRRDCNRNGLDPYHGFGPAFGHAEAFPAMA